MASVSPSESHNKSPLLELRRCWTACNKAEKAAFDLGPWKSDFDEFLTLLMNRGRCGDIHHVQRVTTCNCMQELQTTLSYDDQSQVVDCLVQHAKLDWEPQRQLTVEWKKHGEATRSMLEGQRRNEQSKVCPLPGSSSHKTCKNALATILGKSKCAWENIGKEGKDVHGLAKCETSNYALPKEEVEALHECLFSLTKLGAPRATKPMTDLLSDGTVSTELKDADPELIELPFCNSKRQLYKSHLLSRGFDVGCDSKSRQTTKSHAGFV